MSNSTKYFLAFVLIVINVTAFVISVISLIRLSKSPDAIDAQYFMTVQLSSSGEIVANNVLKDNKLSHTEWVRVREAYVENHKNHVDVKSDSDVHWENFMRAMKQLSELPKIPKIDLVPKIDFDAEFSSPSENHGPSAGSTDHGSGSTDHGSGSHSSSFQDLIPLAKKQAEEATARANKIPKSEAEKLQESSEEFNNQLMERLRSTLRSKEGSN